MNVALVAIANKAVIVPCRILMIGVMFVKRRAELLLRLGRPRAARRDCSAALALNPDSGKARLIESLLVFLRLVR